MDGPGLVGGASRAASNVTHFTLSGFTLSERMLPSNECRTTLAQRPDKKRSASAWWEDGSEDSRASVSSALRVVTREHKKKLVADNHNDMSMTGTRHLRSLLEVHLSLEPGSLRSIRPMIAHILREVWTAPVGLTAPPATLQTLQTQYYGEEHSSLELELEQQAASTCLLEKEGLQHPVLKGVSLSQGRYQRTCTTPPCHSNHLGSFDSLEEAAQVYLHHWEQEHPGELKKVQSLPRGHPLRKEQSLPPPPVLPEVQHHLLIRSDKNKSGYKGVSVYKGRYRVECSTALCQHNYLGTFDTPEDAAQAYLQHWKTKHPEELAKKRALPPPPTAEQERLVHPQAQGHGLSVIQKTSATLPATVLSDAYGNDVTADRMFQTSAPEELQLAVDRILASRPGAGGQLEHLVKWLDMPEDWSEWVPSGSSLLPSSFSVCPPLGLLV